MKITFITNYMTHHQLPFCLEMYKLLGDDFLFIETNSMDEERKKMGWDKEIEAYPFITKWQDKEGRAIVKDSDILLCGGTHENYIFERLDMGKITFRYFERLYKTGQIKAFIPTSFLRKRKEHTGRQKKPVYLLCAGAYVPSDFSLFGAYKNKMLKWGYFTKTSTETYEDINEKRNNDVIKILWTGRMLDWKHPELAVEAVNELTKMSETKKFSLTMIGEGEMKSKVQALSLKYGLDNVITFMDFVDNNTVRTLMEESHIYLMTSDYNEGWGAVVNEAMDKGMTVIGSVGAGAVPYLISDGENGYIFKNQNVRELSEKLFLAVNDHKKREETGRNAYNTIHELWNAQAGAERFVSLCSKLLEGQELYFNEEGPLSVAEVVSPLKGYRYFVEGKK